MDFLNLLLLILFNDPISSKFLEKLTMGKKKKLIQTNFAMN